MNTTRGIQTAGARGPLSLCSWLAPDCTRVHQEFHGEVKPQPRSRSRKERRLPRTRAHGESAYGLTLTAPFAPRPGLLVVGARGLDL